MDAKKLVISVVLCLIAGVIGGLFTAESIPTWYAQLQKPAFNPPNWVFGPVWTTLYVLMGVSFYLIWEKEKNKTPAVIFGVQLLFNVLWSILFFGLRSPFYAFIEIIALWMMIAATILAFHSIDKRASLLLVPYILWVSFAAFLNFSIWQLNP